MIAAVTIAVCAVTVLACFVFAELAAERNVTRENARRWASYERERAIAKANKTRPPMPPNRLALR